jgi:hypothetical protein
LNKYKKKKKKKEIKKEEEAGDTVCIDSKYAGIIFLQKLIKDIYFLVASVCTYKKFSRTPSILQWKFWF